MYICPRQVYSLHAKCIPYLACACIHTYIHIHTDKQSLHGLAGSAWLRCAKTKQPGGECACLTNGRYKWYSDTQVLMHSKIEKGKTRREYAVNVRRKIATAMTSASQRHAEAVLACVGLTPRARTHHNWGVKHVVSSTGSRLPIITACYTHHPITVCIASTPAECGAARP